MPLGATSCAQQRHAGQRGWLDKLRRGRFRSQVGTVKPFTTRHDLLAARFLAEKTVPAGHTSTDSRLVEPSLSGATHGYRGTILPIRAAACRSRGGSRRGALRAGVRRGTDMCRRSHRSGFVHRSTTRTTGIVDGSFAPACPTRAARRRADAPPAPRLPRGGRHFIRTDPSAARDRVCRAGSGEGPGSVAGSPPCCISCTAGPLESGATETQAQARPPAGGEPGVSADARAACPGARTATSRHYDRGVRVRCSWTTATETARAARDAADGRRCAAISHVPRARSRR